MNRIYAVGTLLALLTVAGWLLYTQGGAAMKSKMQKAQIEAVEAGRKQERELQEKANAIVKQQAEDLGIIAADLATDIARLRRERPTRPDVPPTPRATCNDANGSELDSPNSEFLRRSFALAAEQQIELNTCRTMYNKARDKIKSQE